MGLFDRRRAKKSKKEKKKHLPDTGQSLVEEQRGNGRLDEAVQSHRKVVKDFFDEFDIDPEELCLNQECSVDLDDEENA